MALAVKRLALLLALAVAAGAVLAQNRPGPGKFRPQPGGMKAEERQRLREDLNAARRDVYRQAPDQRRYEQRELSAEERERLRRDINDANRDLRRR
jgi:hypothetical protein